MQQLKKAMTELESVTNQIDFNTKNALAKDHSRLKDVFFERPPFHYSVSEELKLFEEKFEVNLSEELKEALSITGNRGFEFSELFDYNMPLEYPDYFLSEKFVEILIGKGVDPSEIKDCYYDRVKRKFDSDIIEAIYDSLNDKTDLLITCISFHHSCGGCLYVALNGPHKNLIVWDNPYSWRIWTIDGIEYEFTSYFVPEEVETIFDRLEKEIIDCTNYLIRKTQQVQNP